MALASCSKEATDEGIANEENTISDDLEENTIESDFVLDKSNRSVNYILPQNEYDKYLK